jgi:hypothetical protein
VYKNTFSGKLRLHEEDEEILGVLSLVFWSLTLIPLLKYIILVLGADDNGEGDFKNPRVFRRINNFNVHLVKYMPFLSCKCAMYVCRWHICSVLIAVQEFQDGTSEQHACKPWFSVGIQQGGTL